MSEDQKTTGLQVRARELEMLLRRLPDPDQYQSTHIALPAQVLPRRPLAAGPAAVDDVGPIKVLIFRREVYSVGDHRWHEWVLDHVK